MASGNKGNRIDITKKVEDFQDKKEEIDKFLEKMNGYKKMGVHKSWCYEYAIIRLYRAFEELMLEVLKGALNRDPKYFLEKNDIKLPTSLNKNLAEYVIVGGGYFDFKGRDGLIEILKKFLPKDHWFVTIVKDDIYRDSLDRLSVLRNYAAHGGSTAKARAKKVLGQERLGTAGTWLSKEGDKEKIRFAEIADDLYEISEKIDK